MINSFKQICRFKKKIYIVLFSALPEPTVQRWPGRSWLWGTITDSRSILLLRLRERTSERLPDDWHGTKYRTVKQLSKNIRDGRKKKLVNPSIQSWNNVELIEDDAGITLINKISYNAKKLIGLHDIMKYNKNSINSQVLP